MLTHLANRIRDYRLFRRHVARLGDMNDRELADIGVTRGDIRHAIRTGRR